MSGAYEWFENLATIGWPLTNQNKKTNGVHYITQYLLIFTKRGVVTHAWQNAVFYSKTKDIRVIWLWNRKQQEKSYCTNINKKKHKEPINTAMSF